MLLDCKRISGGEGRFGAFSSKMGEAEALRRLSVPFRWRLIFVSNGGAFRRRQFTAIVYILVGIAIDAVWRARQSSAMVKFVSG